MYMLTSLQLKVVAHTYMYRTCINKICEVSEAAEVTYCDQGFRSGSGSDRVEAEAEAIKNRSLPHP